MSLQTIVFDFDGTIADTMQEGRAILNELADVHGFKKVAEHEVEALRQLTINEFLKHIGVSKLMLPILLAKGTSMLKSRIPRLPLIDGMREALPQIKNHVPHLGILTSNSQENVELFLQAQGLHHVFDFVSSTSKLTGKAKHLRSICRTFSCEPHNLLYVGDEVRDVKACHRANVPIAAVSWGFNAYEALEKEQPQFLHRTPDQLIDTIHSLLQP